MIWLVCNRCDRSKHADAWDLCDECRYDDRQAARRARQDAVRRIVAPNLGRRTRLLVVILSSTGLLAGILSTLAGLTYLEALAILSGLPAGLIGLVLGTSGDPA